VNWAPPPPLLATGKQVRMIVLYASLRATTSCHPSGQCYISWSQHSFIYPRLRVKQGAHRGPNNDGLELFDSVLMRVRELWPHRAKHSPLAPEVRKASALTAAHITRSERVDYSEVSDHVVAPQ
jgi:hypothetical protein